MQAAAEKAHDKAATDKKHAEEEEELLKNTKEGFEQATAEVEMARLREVHGDCTHGTNETQLEKRKAQATKRNAYGTRAP